jgi:hypothetical protein
MIPAMSTPVSIAVGVFLMVLGCSFFYKAVIATVKGRVDYWAGFLPFTILSIFVLHLPKGKNSLVKTSEGLWVHAIMSPLFFICALFCLVAGAEYAGLPGTQVLNIALSGGKFGHPDSVVFNKRTGFRFPIVARNAPTFMKLFNSQMGLSEKDALLNQEQRSAGSYEGARSNAQGN